MGLKTQIGVRAALRPPDPDDPSQWASLGFQTVPGHPDIKVLASSLSETDSQLRDTPQTSQCDSKDNPNEHLVERLAGSGDPDPSDDPDTRRAAAAKALTWQAGSIV